MTEYNRFKNLVSNYLQMKSDLAKSIKEILETVIDSDELYRDDYSNYCMFLRILEDEIDNKDTCFIDGHVVSISGLLKHKVDFYE